MNNFRLKSHCVKAASFIENKEKEKKNNAEVRVEGGILVPKDSENSKYLSVKLKVYLGNTEERLFLMLDTLSAFEIEREAENIEITEEEVREKCLPVALAELRKTVKKVTEAYGMPALELPPFEEEMC